MSTPIVLAGNDPRWGHYSEDGSIAAYPALDVFGAVYERGYVTMRRINAALFVVIPPGRDSDDLVVIPATAMTELPTDEPRKARK